MKDYRIFDNELYAHFVTFSCYRRRRLLESPAACRIILGVLNSQVRQLSARVIGFVLMPNHVHAVVWFPKTGQLSNFIQCWKQRSSRTIRYRVLPKLPCYQQLIGNDDPIWQSGYHAFAIYESKKLEEKLTYMHLNPVRAGLCSRAADWKWSSAGYYETGRSAGVPITWID